MDLAVTPADEIRTAAATFRGMPGRAAEPMADLVDRFARHPCATSADQCDDVLAALAVARAVNGATQ